MSEAIQAGSTVSAGMGLSRSKAMETLNRMPDGEQLEHVSKQFESIFIRKFLGDAMKPMFKGALGNGEGAGDHIYQQFIVDAMADEMSETGAFGFANSLQAQLSSAKNKKGEDIL